MKIFLKFGLWVCLGFSVLSLGFVHEVQADGVYFHLTAPNTITKADGSLVPSGALVQTITGYTYQPPVPISINPDMVKTPENILFHNNQVGQMGVGDGHFEYPYGVMTPDVGVFFRIWPDGLGDGKRYGVSQVSTSSAVSYPPTEDYEDSIICNRWAAVPPAPEVQLTSLGYTEAGGSVWGHGNFKINLHPDYEITSTTLKIWKGDESAPGYILLKDGMEIINMDPAAPAERLPLNSTFSAKAKARNFFGESDWGPVITFSTTRGVTILEVPPEIKDISFNGRRYQPTMGETVVNNQPKVSATVVCSSGIRTNSIWMELPGLRPASFNVTETHFTSIQGVVDAPTEVKFTYNFEAEDKNLPVGRNQDLKFKAQSTGGLAGEKDTTISVYDVQEVLGTPIVFPSPVRLGVDHGFTLQYGLKINGDVDIYIFDIGARIVKYTACPAGTIGGTAGGDANPDKVPFDLTTDQGSPFAAGIYVVNIVDRKAQRVLSKAKLTIVKIP